MPTPLQILMDPISLIVLGIYGALILLEALFPARVLPKVKWWRTRALLVFAVYFFGSSYLPLIWGESLAQFQLFDLANLNPFVGAAIGVLLFEFFVYVYHRAMHRNHWLWRAFHQMHHSAERVDTYGAFYFSPLDIIGFTFLTSIALTLLGLSPQAATYTLYFTMFLATFQHTNIRTPQWMGYLVQRPESHSLHHARGVHQFNYSDLPLFDILFGTFRNPKYFEDQSGFYDGASARIPEMLVFKDIAGADYDPSLELTRKPAYPHT
ncbi:MAG TPA: sterol desaturase family protein [Steroidobacteraceae bacterium]|nr:sterol desaturase family protein [Steroidobacteraceae bacterium]